jgi:hypothetical protein
LNLTDYSRKMRAAVEWASMASLRSSDVERTYPFWVKSADGRRSGFGWWSQPVDATLYLEGEMECA